MEEKVLRAIADFSMINRNSSVCVALSGGMDSMCLLSVLNSLKGRLEINLSAAHFNHKIRGQEAERDHSFVVKFCKENDIELFSGSADVPAYAQENHLSIELAARKLRYDFFETLSADFIATAHHADDNLETMLLNLTRGTALNGLCGIPPKRERFIRPLILCTRTEIENYCFENKIPYVQDSTNFSDEYTRNRIRHNVLPVLKSINKNIEMAATRTAISLSEDAEFLRKYAQEEYNRRVSGDELLLNDFNKLNKSVAKRVIAKFYRKFSEETDFLHINLIYDICCSKGTVSVSGRQNAVSDGRVLKIIPENFKPQKVDFQVEILQSDNDLFAENKKVHNLLLKNTIDCDKIIGDLVVRTRLLGDKIRLKNKNCTKTLKKLFTEYSIPVEERDVWPVLCDSQGVVWVHKIGVAERCAADSESLKIYKIYVKKNFMGDFIDE